MADLEAENELLREFYKSWCFFHQVRNEKSEAGETWDKTRQGMAAQKLYEAAQLVSKHYQRGMH